MLLRSNVLISLIVSRSSCRQNALERVRDAGAGGSNPLTPTIWNPSNSLSYRGFSIGLRLIGAAVSGLCSSRAPILRQAFFRRVRRKFSFADRLMPVRVLSDVRAAMQPLKILWLGEQQLTGAGSCSPYRAQRDGRAISP